IAAPTPQARMAYLLSFRVTDLGAKAKPFAPHCGAVVLELSTAKRARGPALRGRVVAAALVVLERRAVALLELFAATARAEVVSSDLRCLALHRLHADLRARRWLAAAGTGARLSGRAVAFGHVRTMAELHRLRRALMPLVVLSLEAFDLAFLL